VEQPLAKNSGSLEPLPFTPVLAGSAQGRAGEPVSAVAAGEDAVPREALSFQDQQTLSQLRRGNWSAMEPLIGRYQDRLFVTILRMVNNQEDAADLVQETFVRAMQNVARFEGKSTLYTWLFRIAINLAISHRRSKQYRTAVSLDGDSDQEDNVNRQAAGLRRQLTQETEEDPTTSAEQRMEFERLMAALAKLDPDFKAVIILRDVEECDYEQMAAILEVPVGTIKSRLFRARGALREALKLPARRESA